MILHLDLETRSDVDLPKAGLHVYAKSPHTSVWCAAYAFDDEPIEIWVPGQPVPDRITNHIELGLEVWAHNAPFERHLVNEVLVRRHGWPYLYTEQMVCTMAMAYAMGLPGGLGNAALALGVPAQKDQVGKRLMMQMSQPKGVDELGRYTWWDDPGQIERLIQYCIQDVEVERAICKKILRLSPRERKVWNLDQKINDVGIAVDRVAAINASAMVDMEKARLNHRMQEITGNEVASCQAVSQIKTYLKDHFQYDLESLGKADVADLLTLPELHPRCKEILELRQEAGKSSNAKLSAMVLGSTPETPRVKGTFQYSGANTRRWAGRRIQLQNLPRPKFSPKTVGSILDAIRESRITLEGIDLVYGPPMSVISNCIRGFIVPRPKNLLAACDFSAIEARVIAWLSDETEALNIFRTHGKIYEAAAASIFGVPLEKVTDGQRQVGKVAVLALGYGGGVGAFQAMAKGYSVTMAPAYEALCKAARPDDIALAKKRHGDELLQASESGVDPLSVDEFVASDLTKILWRRANPKIVKFWQDLEEAAIEAVNKPGKVQPCGRISFKVSGSFLWCQLPSKGVICYPYPEVKTQQTRWGTSKVTLSYMAEDNFKWKRFSTYGGSLAENVTQAVARDLLADAMLSLDSKGFEIVGHVHDEVILEILDNDESSKTLEEIAKIMSEVPNWAPGLPLKAAGWTGKRYRK